MTRRPHDALFKAAFDTPKHAAGLLRQVIPPQLCAQIQWHTLARERGSFIDPALRDSHTDLLFSARFNDTRVLLYLLLEHQSTNDPFMPLRMLRYLVNIHERHRRDKAPLPLIIPAVISHAPEGWTAPVSFGELFTPHPDSIPGLGPLVPSFTLLVEDLSDLSNEDLRGWALAAFPKLALWVLRDSRNSARLLHELKHWICEFREALRAPDGTQAVAQLLRYIALVAGGMHFATFRAKIHEQIPEAEEIAMTIAEELRQEGMKKGRQEGMEKGRLEGRIGVLGKLLTLKFGELPPDHAAQIQAASEAQLERYIERILSADTLEAVFAD
ncbi:Mobile element protein [Enhygromyxa salina]|uniref:Mobile element protein n=1 Tax=Enhygromyxa salina TaxID=215803 RepID=A0A0C2A5G9_9BACT|nr:Rpn family recombination-promoting nuclease/putative transposase [Enhygromyxa salina]KIG18688.1 Mobile element protein [Enhygromyxa salina]